MTEMPGLREGDGKRWSRGKLLPPEHAGMSVAGMSVSGKRVSDPFARDYKTFRDFTPDSYGVY